MNDTLTVSRNHATIDLSNPFLAMQLLKTLILSMVPGSMNYIINKATLRDGSSYSSWYAPPVVFHTSRVQLRLKDGFMADSGFLTIGKASQEITDSLS